MRERRIVEVHRDDPDLPAAEAAEMDRWGEMSNLDGPLEFGGQVIGVLGIVESRYCRRYTEAEKQLFAQLAVLAAIAIHNAESSPSSTISPSPTASPICTTTATSTIASPRRSLPRSVTSCRSRC